jgi:alkyl hydroperoxide reductase subunit AhpC
MLSVGASFPSFELSAVVNSEMKFPTITDQSYAGKWKVYFFWPKDFTFVCPTEIAAFGQLNAEFAAATRRCWAAASTRSLFTGRGATSSPP